MCLQCSQRAAEGGIHAREALVNCLERTAEGGGVWPVRAGCKGGVLGKFLEKRWPSGARMLDNSHPGSSALTLSWERGFCPASPLPETASVALRLWCGIETIWKVVLAEPNYGFYKTFKADVCRDLPIWQLPKASLVCMCPPLLNLPPTSLGLPASFSPPSEYGDQFHIAPASSWRAWKPTVWWHMVTTPTVVSIS